MRALILLAALLMLTTSLRLSHFHSLSKERLSELQQKDLAAHNQKRANHHADDLLLDTQLSSDAQKWAHYLADNSKFEHAQPSDRNDAGENLYLFMTTGDPHENYKAGASKQWYAEVANYDYSNPRFSPNTGHFTQLVWKASKEVGFGYAEGTYTVAGKTYNALYVVARYLPAGNVHGRFDKNVLQP